MTLDAVECAHDVIINDEKQFSIWPQNLSVPDGWQREGFFGPKSACLTHIDQVWQDLRPLSLQRRMSVFEFPLSLPKRCEFPKDPGDAGLALRVTEQSSANAPLLLHEFFEAQVRERPAAVAVVFGQTSLSYRELNTRANRLAHFLRTVGVGPDVLVGIAVERSLDMAVGIMGIAKAGGAYVPLDTAYPAERLTYMMQDAKLTLVLTQQHLIAQLPQDSARFWCLDSDWVEAESLPDTDLSIPVDPANLAYCIYTSGSTGRPKGVLMTHSAVISTLLWTISYTHLTEDDCAISVTSFSFDPSVLEFWNPLVVGGRCVMAHPRATQDPAILFHDLTRQRVTVMFTTPSLLSALLPQSYLDELPSLRHVVSGGEVLTPELKNNFLKNCTAQLHNVYGPTEAAIFATCGLCDENANETSVSIGRAITPATIEILGPDLTPVANGEAGEVFIGGLGLARGYHNRPGLTAERFPPDPSGHKGERLYRTGDVARFAPDGKIYYIGRVDQQVKIRGHRIELGEIEATLLARPGVQEAVVLAREDRPGEKRLVAYVTGKEEDISTAVLRTHLASALPEFMVPVAFVRLDAFPLSPNGKLDRRALRAPEGDAFSSKPYAAPEGAIETALAAIWAELLHLDRIGRHDNFFELGGHSFLAISLIERVRRKGWHPDVQAIFSQPTIAGLAASLKNGRAEIEVPPNKIPAGCTHITPELLPLVTFAQSEIDGIVATVPGGAANVQDIYPLAPLQEGILFHHLFATEGDTYLLSTLRAFDSKKHLFAYLAALQLVINRHDILRTAIAWENLPEPVQVVWREASLTVEESAFEGADVARQLRDRFNNTRIDVRRAPLLGAYIAQDAAEDRWLLLLLCHHMAIDHTTLGLITEEVRVHLAGTVKQLPAPLPYRNFVVEARLGMSAKEHEGFFRQLLADIDETTAPFGLIHVHGDGSGIAQARLALKPELALRLRTAARRMGVTVASLFHLAWALVLARTSGGGDVVFGTVLFGRMQGGAGADSVLGMFINTLPLRLSINATPVQEAVRETHVRLARLLHHEHAPLSLAQRCSAVPAPAPLFSALLNYRSARVGAGNLAETELPRYGTPIEQTVQRTNYPLTLSVDDTGEGFDLSAQAPEEIDPARVCGFMQTALEQLAWALEDAPNTQVVALDVLPENERHQVLYAWNKTGTTFPEKQCIHALFEEQVTKTPDTIALVFQGVELTYAELNATANRCAHHLITLGVKPDTFVGIALERGPEMVIALLATLKAGAAYVPLDPEYPTERLTFMIEDSAPKVLLTQQSVRQALGRLPDTLPILMLDIRPAPWATLPTTNPDPTALGLTSVSLAYVIYTSGSTGMPKGVTIAHFNAVNLIHWAKNVYAPSELERTLFSTSISFDLAIFELFVPLSTGATVHLVADALSLAQTSANITLINTVPSAIRALLEAGSVPNTTLTINLAGEPLMQDLVHHIFAETTAHTVYNLYGPSETTTYSTWMKMNRGEGFNASIGRPLANTQIYILDRHGMPVPVGVVGEIYVGGAGVARGYLNRPKLTAERFAVDPFVFDRAGTGQPARMYKTGDLGRWLQDGTIKFYGRNDTQVKIRGFRIEIGEIEATLLTHPEVHEAIVLAREDKPGEKRLVAYFTGGQDINAAVLRAHLASALPEYMVPAAYVRLDALPLTSNGKLDRNALHSREGVVFAAESFEAPKGAIEPVIASIWADLLHAERVGRHDNFFALGGHSIIALRFISIIERFLGRMVSPAAIFDAPTPAMFASFVNNIGGPVESDHLVPLIYSGSKTPLFCLHGEDGRLGDYVHLVRHLKRGRPIYGLRLGTFEAELDTNLTLENLSSCYVAEIRKVQPTGPYWVCGYSFGGLVAFDVARHLIAQGAEVYLILLDAFLMSKWRWILFWLSVLLGRIREKTFLSSLRRRRERNWRPNRVPDTGYDMRARALHRIPKHYKYRPFFGSAVLIQCVSFNRELALLNRDKLNGWSKYLKGKTEVIKVAGVHYRFLKDSTVEEVARQIDHVLSRPE
jgi:amino acid adenylation domain-containing protein